MKKIFSMMMLFAMVLSQTGLGIAEESLSPKELAKQKKAELMGTSYNIVLTTMDEQAIESNDVMSIANNKISLASLQAQGYGPSNFTVKIKEDNLFVFDTMQRTENEDRAFLHVELREDQVSGYLTLETVTGKVTRYSY